MIRDFSAEDTLQKIALKCEGAFSGNAVICEERILSYEDFDSITGKLAFALAAKGAVPGSYVAVKMKRTEKMICALFAVIKTGAALVPMPYDIPEMRERMICENIQI